MRLPSEVRAVSDCEIVEVRSGSARHGGDWSGMVGSGKGHSVGELRIVPAAGECYGRAVNGMVGRGLAMLGKDSLSWWRFRE